MQAATLEQFFSSPNVLLLFLAILTCLANIVIGVNIISRDKKLSFSQNFFKMMFNKVPDKEIVRAFDISLILYAEHSFNVSTFTERTITRSISDIHSAITCL